MSSSKTLVSVAAGVAAAAAAAAATAGGLRFYKRFMVRREAAADVLTSLLPVHSRWWRDRLKQPGELSYVALGDSAAQGIGASTPEHSYVGRIAAHLRHITHASVGVVNLSISGATTHLCKIDQMPRLVDHPADIVTIAIGSNDIGNFNATKFERNIRAIYQKLPAHAIVADLPFMLLPDLERKVAIGNDIIRRLAADYDLPVAPLYATTRRQGYVGTYRNTAKDLFHPNDKGYQVWASAFYPAVEARLAELRKPKTTDHAAHLSHVSGLP